MNPQNQGQQPTPNLTLPAVDPQQAQPVQQPAPAQPAAQPPAQPASQPTEVGTDSPQIADDADLIEKEWVEKAKQLVEQTKNDPYQQNKAINKFKADYIKKRYNKDIKLSQD